MGIDRGTVRSPRPVATTNERYLSSGAGGAGSAALTSVKMTGCASSRIVQVFQSHPRA